MKLDYEEFRPLLGTWAEKFKSFIEGPEMYEIYQKLKNDPDIIVPKSDNVFRAFQECDWRNIKSIWYLMDPYPKRYKGGINRATGIAMDCSNSPDGNLQPSLEKFYDAMSKELGHKVVYSPKLDYLHHQGVMLLNTDLTCKLAKTGSHEGLWEPFQKFLLEEIMREIPGVVYVLAGKASHRMEKYISPFERILKI